MGQIVEFVCNESGCGWRRTAMVGGGLHWIGHLPHLCRDCRHLTLVNGGSVVEETVGRCSKCRRKAEPWPEVDDKYEPVTPAECPKCAKQSVRFEYFGLWD